MYVLYIYLKNAEWGTVYFKVPAAFVLRVLVIPCLALPGVVFLLFMFQVLRISLLKYAPNFVLPMVCNISLRLDRPKGSYKGHGHSAIVIGYMIAESRKTPNQKCYANGI